MGEGRERILSRLHTQRGAQGGVRSHNSEIVPCAETESQTLHRLNHPGAPSHFCNCVIFPPAPKRPCYGSNYLPCFHLWRPSPAMTHLIGEIHHLSWKPLGANVIQLLGLGPSCRRLASPGPHLSCSDLPPPCFLP